MASWLLGSVPMGSQSMAVLSPNLSFSRAQFVSGISICSATSSPSSIHVPIIYCGRGDKKTAKGKRFNHSFGNARPRDKTKGRGPPRVPAPPSGPKRDPFDDDKVIKIEIHDSM